MPQISHLNKLWKQFNKGLELYTCKNYCNDMGRAWAAHKSSIYVSGLLTHIHCGSLLL